MNADQGVKSVPFLEITYAACEAKAGSRSLSAIRTLSSGPHAFGSRRARIWKCEIDGPYLLETFGPSGFFGSSGLSSRSRSPTAS